MQTIYGDDEHTIREIFEHVERLAADGRSLEAAAVARELAQALGECATAERPALLARRELSRIGDEARRFLHGA